MTAAAQQGTPRRRRRGPGWVPNQHGAWAMLASPLLVGAIASGFAWVHLPLTLFWFAGYLAFNATALWLKSGRKPRYAPPVRWYTVIAAALGLVVLVAQPRLAVWAPAFLVPLGVGLWAASRRRERDTLAGLTTVIGSALMTVVAYAAGPGIDLRHAALLAAVQFLYFGGTVPYVKSAIRERGNRRYLAFSVAFHAVATALAWALGGPWLAAVFALLAVRAAVLPPRGLTPKAIGIVEIGATAVVAVVSLLTV